MNWRSWFGSSVRPRGRRDQDIDREIRSHLDLEAEEQQEAGMSEPDARAAAARAFGNRTLIAEDLRAMWGRPSIDALLQDIRYALRAMRRSPGFAAIAIGSSALGIGACTVVFTVLNGAVFKPLPVDDPGGLMRLSERDGRTGESGGELSYLDFLDLRQARSFAGIAAYDPLLPASIRTHGDAQRHWGALATANYFDLVKPAFALGRGFDPLRDDTRGAPPVVVLSHELWQRAFDGDPEIVGRSISIDRSPTTVIGVTAAGFRGTDVGIVPEFWIPFSMIDEVELRSGPVTANRTRFWLFSVVRLRPDITSQQARAELDVIARTLNGAHGREHDRGFGLERAGQIDPRLRSMTLTLFSVTLAVTVLVLLTACSNVANLLLGRARARRREIATRMALGAGRVRLVRQLMTESLMLAIAGGVGGWLIAQYLSSFLGLVQTPLGWPLDLSVSPDYRVLLFCVALSVATGLAFGLLPAIRGTRPDLVTDLKADASGKARRRRLSLGNGLVVGQITICTVLLLCMGLSLRSLQAARAIDTGLRAPDVVLLAFDPSLDRRTDRDSQRLLRDVLMSAQSVPGVESASLTSAVPLTLIVSNSNFVSADEAGDAQAPRVQTDIYAIGPHFFSTMGMSFLAGEDFRVQTPGDRTPIVPAIVNEAFARTAFPGQSPIGRRVLGDGKSLAIVGVVTTAKSRSIGEAPRPSIYVPILSAYSAKDAPRGVTLVARTTKGFPGSVTSLREAIHNVDRSLAVFDVRSMESQVRDALILPRLMWAVAGIAGAIGLLLATIGVYGVMSFAVVSRRRELGIRLAIGARPGGILAMVVSEGGVLAVLGTGLGSLMALGVTRFAASLLYGVSPADPLTFILAPTFLLIIALTACLVPARAASRLNPVDVLKGD